MNLGSVIAELDVTIVLFHFVVCANISQSVHTPVLRWQGS